MDSRLHLQENLMYLDDQAIHKLQHPKNTNDHWIKLQQYELYHKQLP
jgi:hypothetical protein